jgi:hypothetical protein
MFAATHLILASIQLYLIYYAFSRFKTKTFPARIWMLAIIVLLFWIIIRVHSSLFEIERHIEMIPSLQEPFDIIETFLGISAIAVFYWWIYSLSKKNKLTCPDPDWSSYDGKKGCESAKYCIGYRSGARVCPYKKQHEQKRAEESCGHNWREFIDPEFLD